MTVRPIQLDSPDYGQELALREAVLRKPLGLRFTDADREQDRRDLHYGLFEPGGALRGCAIASPRSPAEVRIRQMAVAEAWQGRGLGRQLMAAVETDLASRGFTRLFLHARLSAVGFYRKLGYAAVGNEFLEVSIPHIEMEKTIGG